MKKTKVVHLISSLKIGGAESLMPDLIQGLGFEQFEHELFYFHKGPNAERIQALGVPVQQIQGAFFLYDPIFFWRLWRSIKTSKPHVLHCALWSANFIGRFIAFIQKIPVLCVVHLGVDQDGFVRNFLDRPTFFLATQVVAVSHGVAASIYKKNWIPATRVTTIVNGIKADEIVARAQGSKKSRQQLGLSETDFVVGSVGRFIARKNFPLLLHSFADLAQRVANARLLLVGTGPQEHELRVLAKKLGIAEKTIFVVGQSAYGYYPLFDIFVLCSWQEGLSIALLEAMSCSLPCIITTVDGTHELINSGINGQIALLNDKKSLTQEIEKMATEINLRHFFGEKARETVDKKFRLDRMIDAYRNVIKSLEK